MEDAREPNHYIENSKYWERSKLLSFYMQTVPPDNQMADEGKLLFKEIFQLKSKEGMIMIELKHHHFGTSLLAQWLKIRLPMQGTQVRALLWEDPTCHGATKLVRQNY